MESAAIGPVKPQFRSRIGNGNAILPDVDGRSGVMRRYKEILTQIVSDIGGDLSEAENIIVRRILSALTLLDADQHARRVDVGHLERHDLGHP